MPARTTPQTRRWAVEYARELVIRGMGVAEACRTAGTLLGVNWKTVQGWLAAMGGTLEPDAEHRRTSPVEVGELIQEEMWVIERRYRLAAANSYNPEAINLLASLAVLAEKARKLSGEQPRRPPPPAVPYVEPENDELFPID